MEPDLAYTYQDHKRYLDAFIEALDLRNVTLVIHDWGSVLGFDYAVEHDDNVVGIAFMESIIPPSFPRSEPMGGPLGRYRTDAGEDLILEQNQFVEQILPGSVVRGLTDEEMEYYRGPYPTPESRIPTLQWPRELPAGGEPARNVEVVTRIGGWMQGTDIPMLFFWARPGALNNEAFAEAMVERVTNIQTAFVATSRTSSKPVPTSAKENTMGSDKSWQSRPVSASLGLPLALAMVLLVPMAGVAQGPGTENGQWTYLGGDAWHTRYTPADQINASNFEDLGGGVAVERGQLWAEHPSCDADLHQRTADHGHRRPS